MEEVRGREGVGGRWSTGMAFESEKLRAGRGEKRNRGRENEKEKEAGEGRDGRGGRRTEEHEDKPILVLWDLMDVIEVEGRPVDARANVLDDGTFHKISSARRGEDDCRRRRRAEERDKVESREEKAKEGQEQNRGREGERESQERGRTGEIDKVHHVEGAAGLPGCKTLGPDCAKKGGRSPCNAGELKD